MRTTSRVAGALASTLTLALLAGCGGSGADAGAEGGPPPEVAVSLVPGIPANVPIVIGQQQGFFERNGVDVELLPMPTGTTSSQVLLSGTANYSTTPVASMAQAFQQNQRVSYNCGAQMVNPTSILAPPGSGLPTTASGADWPQIAAALEGGTVGLPVPVGTTLQAIRDQAFREAGVDPAGLTYVNTGGGPSLVGALTSGSVTVADAQTPTTEGLTTGAEAVAEEIIYLPEDGPDAYRDYGTGYVASTEWLTENPDASGRFCAAIGEIMDWIADPANSDAFAAAIQEVAGEMDPAALDRTEERLRTVFSAEIPQDRVQAALDTAMGLPGVLDPAQPLPTFEDLVKTSPPPAS